MKSLHDQSKFDLNKYQNMSNYSILETIFISFVFISFFIFISSRLHKILFNFSTVQRQARHWRRHKRSKRKDTHRMTKGQSGEMVLECGSSLGRRRHTSYAARHSSEWFSIKAKAGQLQTVRESGESPLSRYNSKGWLDRRFSARPRRNCILKDIREISTSGKMKWIYYLLFLLITTEKKTGTLHINQT